VTGLVFGIGPALHVARAQSASLLRAGGRGTLGGTRSWLRKLLLVVELSLAAALLVVAMLLIRSLDRLEKVELGFQPEHLLTFQLNIPSRIPHDPRPFAFYGELLPALAGLPGVKSSALSSGVPFGAGTYSATPVRPNGASLLPVDAALTVDWRLA